MQEIRSSNPSVVTGLCDPNKCQSRHYINLFSLHNFKKNEEMILDYFLKKSTLMNEAHVCGTKLDNPLRFRLSKIKEIENVFISDISK